MTEKDQNEAPTDGTYLAIQPITKWTAMVAVKGERVPNPSEATVLYDSIEMCIDSNVEEANATDFGYRVSSKQILDTLSRDPEALIRVYRAFMENAIDRDVAIAIVKSMQANGVIFSVRPDTKEDPKSASEGHTEAPEGDSESVISTEEPTA